MKLIKLNLNYLLNKKVIMIFCISLLVFLVNLFFSSKFWVNEYEKQMYHYIYFKEYINNVRFIYNITIFVSIVIFSYSFDKNQDSYSVFVLTRGINKYKYFIYKVITILIFMSLYTGLIVFLVYLVGRFNGFLMNDFKYLYLVYLESICYGLISLMLTILFRSSIVNIIVIILFWMNEVLTGFNIKYLHMFIPHVIKEDLKFYYGIDYVIMYIVLMVLLNSYLYANKEFN